MRSILHNVTALRVLHPSLKFKFLWLPPILLCTNTLVSNLLTSMPAFATSAPLFTRRAHAPALCARPNVRVRRSTVVHAPRMDLVTEVMVKGLEVFAATYATRALSQSGTKSEDGSGGVRDAVPNFANLPQNLRSVLENAEAGAARLPEYIESASPDQRKWIKLGMCIVIDLIGSGSLPIPFVADALDLAWAPVDALALQALFGNGLVTAAGFAEEILPGTDGIPTATLAWVYEFYGDDIRRAVDGATEVEATPVKEEKSSIFGSVFGKREKAKR